MLMIDAQVHAYERDHPGRSWAAVLTGPDEVTGDDMIAASRMTEGGPCVSMTTAFVSINSRSFFCRVTSIPVCPPYTNIEY